MKIRVFLLGTENKSATVRFEDELRQLFAANISEENGVGYFDTLRDATSEIADAVTDSHALIFMADTEQYVTAKRMLAKAFRFQLSCDSTLLEKACKTMEKDTAEPDSDFAVAHAFVPKNAKTFVLGDGLYSGFAVASGNQTIILLPLEKGRATVLLSSQVVPYLNTAYHESISTDALKKYNADLLFRALDRHSATMAVAGTNTADFLKEYLSCDERLNDMVVVSPVAEKRGELQPVDYVVNLSITASELMSCPYSVAVSNAFYTGDSPESEKIVYLAVTNDRETAVREIHSMAGEDISVFLERCCGDLCAFVSDCVADDIVFRKDVNKREKAAVKRYKIAIAVVAALIVALGAFVGTYFVSNEYTLGKWYDSFVEMVFPAGNPLDAVFGTTETETTTAEETTTKKKSSKTEKTTKAEKTTNEEKTSEDEKSTKEEKTTKDENTTEAEKTTKEENTTKEESTAGEDNTLGEFVLYG